MVDPMTEPQDWRAGDRAYCIKAAGPLVRGRLYRVSGVIEPNGLQLYEVFPPEPFEGFYATRFIRVRAGDDMKKGQPFGQPQFLSVTEPSYVLTL